MEPFRPWIILATGVLPLRGTGPMPHYRLYFLNPHTGHIDGAEDFRSVDDAEAIRLIRRRRETVPTELWCGGRKVSRVDAHPEMAATADVRRQFDFLVDLS
jgi:hypothetical protein